MKFAQAERELLEVTGRSPLADALAWISEGRALRRPLEVPVLLEALGAVADEAPDADLVALADRSLKLVCRTQVRSELDPSTVLLALHAIPRPALFRAALDTLAGRTVSKTLKDVTLAAVNGAQADDPNVMSTLCAVAGLSYRDLKSRAAPTPLPGKVTGPWRHDQLKAAFAVIDRIVSNEVSSAGPAVPMRPVEHLLAEIDDPEHGQERQPGWSLVEDMRVKGVPFEVLLTQRVVGSSWGAHRNSTSNLVQGEVTTALCELLTERGVPFDRLSRNAASRELLSRAGAPFAPGSDHDEPNESGQVTVLAHNDSGFAHAIIVSVARDGGTASKSGAKLTLVPGRLGILCSVVLVGPGWAERNETSILARAFSGRVYTELTLESLAAALQTQLVATGLQSMSRTAGDLKGEEGVR